MFKRFVEKCPVEFANHSAFKPLLECAILCLKHQHREANASTCKFIKSVLTCNYNGMVRHLYICLKKKFLK